MVEFNDNISNEAQLTCGNPLLSAAASTELPTKHEPFLNNFFSLNNFLQVLNTQRDYFSKTATFRKINLVVSKTLCIFVSQVVIQPIEKQKVK